MAEAMAMIVRDGCDAKAVHNALVEPEEYRASVPDDMQRPMFQADPQGAEQRMTKHKAASAEQL